MIDWIINNKEWLFSGLGIAAATAVISIVVRYFKTKRQRDGSQSILPAGTPSASVPTTQSETGSVIIGDGVVVGGHIAGRDVIVKADELKPRLQELIRILNHRAHKIVNDLSPHYNYAKVRDYLKRFQELHTAHVEALEKNNITHAHELLCSIHELSFELERDEFWSRHEAETPEVVYSLETDAFTRGRMICGYVVGEIETYSPKYPSSRTAQLPSGHPLRGPVSAYKIVLGEAPPEPDPEEVMAAIMSKYES